MTTRVPLIRPTLPTLDPGVVADIARIWESGQVTTGREVAAFEAAVAARIGVPHVVAVASCTSGLMLTLRALDLDGEIVVPSFTWTATAQAALWCGLVPVLVDCDPVTLTMRPDRLLEAIGPRTKVVMPVTVFGCPPDVDALGEICRARGLRLVYDSAQGLGSTWRGTALGGFGDAEVFSLSPTKVVTAMEGGLVATRDPALATKVRRMRDYGKTPDGADFDLLGLSARMPEVSGLVGRLNLARIDAYVARRTEVVARYRAALAGPGLSFQEIPADRTTNWNYFVVRIDAAVAGASRDAIWTALRERGIETKRYFYPALHGQTVLGGDRTIRRGSLEASERASADSLALPLHNDISDAAVDTVVEAILRELAR